MLPECSTPPCKNRTWDQRLPGIFTSNVLLAHTVHVCKNFIYHTLMMPQPVNLCSRCCLLTYTSLVIPIVQFIETTNVYYSFLSPSVSSKPTYLVFHYVSFIHKGRMTTRIYVYESTRGLHLGRCYGTLAELGRLSLSKLISASHRPRRRGRSGRKAHMVVESHFRGYKPRSRHSPCGQGWIVCSPWPNSLFAPLRTFRHDFTMKSSSTTRPSATATTITASATIRDHLSPLLPLLDAFNHRNKNQHHASHWWSHFSILRRSLRALVFSSTSRETSSSGLLSRVRWLRDRITPGAYMQVPAPRISKLA